MMLPSYVTGFVVTTGISVSPGAKLVTLIDPGAICPDVNCPVISIAGTDETYAVPFQR